MAITEAEARIVLKSILYLTDFSKPSEEALPFAIAVARKYGGVIYALHILTPLIPQSCAAAAKADEDIAELEMKKVDSQLAGVEHETRVERGIEMWPSLEQAIRKHKIDVIVLGTHGRTGAQKLLLGSVAEEIFRHSPVPVLTIGPNLRGGIPNDALFRRVLFATDFTPDSIAAAPYAVSLAQEKYARLILFHVMPKIEQRNDASEKLFETSVAETIHQLYQTVPKDTELYCPPEVALEYGEPADGILAAAKQRAADVIVLGVRRTDSHLGAATHLGRATAHQVVAHAPCPVLTVRGSQVDRS